MTYVTPTSNGGVGSCPLMLLGPAYRRAGRIPEHRLLLEARVREFILAEERRGGLTQLCRLWRAPGRHAAGVLPAVRSVAEGMVGGPYEGSDDFILFADGRQVHFSSFDVGWIWIPAHSKDPYCDPSPVIYAAPRGRGRG